MSVVAETYVRRLTDSSRSLLAGGFALASTGAAYVYSISPTGKSFLPSCQFHALTGLYCPGCGATRALHSLLHGNVDAAFAFNPLLVTVLPFVIVLAGGRLRYELTGKRFRFSLLNVGPRFAYSVAIVLVTFAVLRNLPFAPFTGLAPHVV